MNKNNLFVIPFFLLAVSSCGANDFHATINENMIDKITVGSTINFANYLTYDNDVNLDITYTTEKSQNKPCQSIYFLTNEVSVHTFTFTFTKNGKNKVLSCQIDVVAKSPSIQESTNAVFVNKGETIEFDDLFNESGIDAMPFGYVDISFLGVRYTPCYSSEYVQFDTLEESIYSEIDKSNSAFTFNDYGKYIFDLDIFNSEGHIYTNLQVSVIDSGNQDIDNMVSKGTIKGEDNLVQLVRSNSMSNLSYLYFEEALNLNESNEYTITCEFKGKNAPQVILLSNTLDGKKYSGEGFIISLEEDIKNQFGVYGFNRLNDANQSPKRSDGNTFSRKNLFDGIVYKWEICFRKTLQNNLTYKLAIKSNLYMENELYREYSWVSFEVEHFNETSYFGYLGSSLDDITFKYNPIDVKEVL